MLAPSPGQFFQRRACVRNLHCFLQVLSCVATSVALDSASAAAKQPSSNRSTLINHAGACHRWLKNSAGVVAGAVLDAIGGPALIGNHHVFELIVLGQNCVFKANRFPASGFLVTHQGRFRHHVAHHQASTGSSLLPGEARLLEHRCRESKTLL